MKIFFKRFILLGFTIIILANCQNSEIAKHENDKYLENYETTNQEVISCISSFPYESSGPVNDNNNRYTMYTYPLQSCFLEYLRYNPDIEICMALKAVDHPVYSKEAATCFTYFAIKEESIEICDNLDNPSTCQAIVENDSKYCYELLEDGSAGYLSVIRCLEDTALHNGNYKPCLEIDSDKSEEWESHRNSCLQKSANIPSSKGESIDSICDLMLENPDGVKQNCINGKIQDFHSTIYPY